MNINLGACLILDLPSLLIPYDGPIIKVFDTFKLICYMLDRNWKGFETPPLSD